jgi:hypothetical protein
VLIRWYIGELRLEEERGKPGIEAIIRGKDWKKWANR